MRLQVFSDLHLESCPIEPTPKNADVVVLAGDINQGTAGVEWAKKHWPDLPVIYVAGNHEFYHHAMPGLIKELRHEAKTSNVHVLENNAVEIGGYVFLGCSLWTDFKLWPDPAEAMRYRLEGVDGFEPGQRDRYLMPSF